MIQLESNELSILGIGYFKNQIIKIFTHGFYYMVANSGIQIFKSSNKMIDFEDILKLKNCWNKLEKILVLFKSINKLIIKFLKFAKSRF